MFSVCSGSPVKSPRNSKSNIIRPFSKKEKEKYRKGIQLLSGLGDWWKGVNFHQVKIGQNSREITQLKV